LQLIGVILIDLIKIILVGERKDLTLIQVLLLIKVERCPKDIHCLKVRSIIITMKDILICSKNIGLILGPGSIVLIVLKHIVWVSIKDIFLLLAGKYVRSLGVLLIIKKNRARIPLALLKNISTRSLTSKNIICLTVISRLIKIS